MFHKWSLIGQVSIVATVLIIILGLLAVSLFYFFSLRKESDKESEAQVQTAQYLKLLTSHSHPEAGEEWVVSFETEGAADLTIAPEDQDSINDLDFVSMKCAPSLALAEEGFGQEVNSEIQGGDVLFVPNWSCDGVGIVTHLVNIARKHTLRFRFGNKAAFAYNNPDSVTDSFEDESKIDSKSNITVDTGTGQVKLSTCADKGDGCSVDGDCCGDTPCVDYYCCDSACGGACDRCDVAGSLGTCTDVNSECAGTGASCYCSSGNCQACSNTGSSCYCSGYACQACSNNDSSCTCSGYVCQACAACKSCSSYSCSVNRTTNWSAGTYGCGSDDKRCYNGTCHDCSAEGGLFYWDGCSCVSFRSSSNKVCWRRASSDESCTTHCASPNACVSANWNDNTTCTMMKLWGYCGDSCDPRSESEAPYKYTGRAGSLCYYRSGAAQDCDQATGGALLRLCVCQY